MILVLEYVSANFTVGSFFKKLPLNEISSDSVLFHNEKIFSIIKSTAKC